MRQPKRAVRGVSLIEAVVALAVMAFGMLAYVGLQSALRFNSDISKQRSEAVRIAQEAIEEWRAYGGIESKDDSTDYAEIASTAPETIADETTNTTYTLQRGVVDAAATPAAPRVKTLVVDVSWLDRNGDEQAVRLSTTVAASPPELAGTLGMPGDGPIRLPQGRHPGVPAQAKNLVEDVGKSAFKPPGAGAAVVWVFDNLSGVITSVCTFPGDDLSQLVVATDCISKPSYLLSGFVRFSPGATPDATNPTGEQIDLGMLATAVGAAFADGECFVTPVQEPKLTHTAYVCRVPQSADSTWTGSTVLGSPLDLGLLYDVCRNTNDAAGNAGHPQVYVHMDRSLSNQNFLVVSEGVVCPTGTLAHQPPL